MAETLLALSLHGIWPWAIIHLDKRVENRSPRFAAQIVQRVGEGWLAIHATKNIGSRPGRPATLEAFEGVTDMATFTAGWRTHWEPTWRQAGVDHEEPGARFEKAGKGIGIRASQIPLSAVVAVCRLGRVIPPGEDAPWKVHASAAVELLDVRPLREPVPCKGSQGLWRLPAGVHAAVEAQGVLGGR